MGGILGGQLIAMTTIRAMIQMAPPAVVAERVAICGGCEHFQKVARRCKLCGCFVHLKAKAQASKCPAGKW